jgi:hypothetical protein
MLHRTQQLRIDPRQPRQGPRIQAVILLSTLSDQSHAAPELFFCCASFSGRPARDIEDNLLLRNPRANWLTGTEYFLEIPNIQAQTAEPFSFQ